MLGSSEIRLWLRFAVFAPAIALLTACGESRVAARAHPDHATFIADPAVVDFGVIGSLAPVQTTVRLLNPGKQPLTIEKSLGSCTCTVGRISTETIAPGQTAELTVAFDPRGRLGPQQSKVNIFEKGKPHPKSIEIHANAEAAMEVSAQVVEFEAGVGDEIQKKTYHVTSLDGGAFEILEIVAPDSLRARVIPAPDPWASTSRAIEFEAVGGLSQGEHRGSVLIKTSHPLQSQILWPSVVNLRPTLKTRPASIYLHSLKPGEAGKAEIQVSRHDGKPFEILDVHSFGDRLAVNFEPGERAVHELAVVFKTVADSATQENAVTDVIHVHGDSDKGEFAKISVGASWAESPAGAGDGNRDAQPGLATALTKSTSLSFITITLKFTRHQIDRRAQERRNQTMGGDRR